MDLTMYVQAQIMKTIMSGSTTVEVPAHMFNQASESSKEMARNLCLANNLTLVVT